ncbi:hypothetical protein GCM10007167_23880 [Vulcaniibacterium thermophilum]|uniref:General secretion pathway protein C n=1 Tax=Vulcaniibacterium thermophilum TaxID=1169913 RepID=A0A919DEN2_9GAMM|nr:hypothetical protein GCM10007167_23880 [Vulcaniibacterium thermophilum]
MSAGLRIILGMVLAAALGGLLAFRGGLPRTDAPRNGARAEWSLPAPAKPALASADRIWEERAPWGAPPPPPPPPEPPPPPPPVPVGVVKSGRFAYAVFVVPGAPAEYHVRVGGRLPDGGRVMKISRSRVIWKDGRGEQHDQELLADPLPLLRNPVRP